MDQRYLLRYVLFLSSMAAPGCGGDEPSGAPTTGTLEVTASTTGAETDPDGYTVQVDAQQVQTIDPAGSVTNTGVTPGNHTLQLGEIAANCSITGDNPRTVNVPAGQTVTVTFAVTCSATTGTIRVMVATSGSPPDPDGYVAKLDDKEPGVSLGPEESASFTGVTVGSHTVVLNGVASNCTVSQGASRSIRVTPGTSSELDLAVTCTAQTGSLEVATSTTGASPDPDGYTVSVDGGTAAPIVSNGTLPVPDLAPGAHSLALAGLAANCSVEGENPRSVTVTAGTSTPVGFAIACPTPVESPWVLMPTGTGKLLTSIWGSSATDGFAIGEDVTCGVTCAVESGLLHFDGTSWSTQQAFAGVIRDVWAGSATDAFAVGADYPTYFATFLHHDGSSWSQMPAPAIDAEGALLLGLWGSSGTDVFAVGSLWPFDAGFYEAYVAHYNGAAWSPMQVGPGSCSAAGGGARCNVELTDVWGSSGTDVYAVGNYRLSDVPEEDRAVILHYNGQAWSEVVREPNLEFRRIWGSSPTDIYVTGNTLIPGESANERGAGALWHFNGTGWSSVPSPTPSPLGAIWGSSASDIYLLAGAQASSGTIWHFDGTAWTPINTGAIRLLDIWGSSASDVYAVGENGTIFHGPAAAAGVMRKVAAR